MSIRCLLLSSIATSSFLVTAAAFAQQPPPALPPPAPTAPASTVTLPPPPPAPPGAVTIVPAPGSAPATPAYGPPTSYAPGYGPPVIPAPGNGPPGTTPGYGSPAYGQPAYGSPPPYAHGYPPPPPYLPPPPVEQGVHLHDGFYLRMAIGLGYMRSTFTPKQGASETVSGNGGAIEFGMGGAVADGFILGGKVSSLAASQPESKSDGQTAKVDGTLGLVSLQFFADFYPMPEDGFHLQAGIGPASLSYNPASSSTTRADSKSTGGFAGSIGVGWEGWVGKQWGIGALFNLNMATFTDNSAIPSLNGTTNAQDSKSAISVIAPSLLFTATLN